MEKSDSQQLLPSYEQSITSNPTAPPPRNPTSNDVDHNTTATSTPTISPIEARRRETRTRRINDLLSTHIEPLLQFRLLDDGITGKLVFIIVPSDVLKEQREHLTSKHVVGSNAANSSEIAGVMRLEGDEHRAAFWQQEGVIADLAVSLRRWVAGFGYRVEGNNNNSNSNNNNNNDGDDGNGTGKRVDGTSERGGIEANKAEQLSTVTGTAAPNDGQTKEKSQFRLKKASSSSTSNSAPVTERALVPPYDRIAITSYKLGWRADEEDSLPRRKLDPDEVRVLSRAKDVSFRVENFMGLYETVTEKVVWLKVEIGV